jgi:hypothetical protein
VPILRIFCTDSTSCTKEAERDVVATSIVRVDTAVEVTGALALAATSYPEWDRNLASYSRDKRELLPVYLIAEVRSPRIQ